MTGEERHEGAGFARLYAKFDFTFGKKRQRVGNNPINILPPSDPCMLLLASL